MVGRIRVHHAVVRREGDEGAAGRAAKELGQRRVEPLEPGEPGLAAPALAVTRVVQLPHVEVDEVRAAVQRPHGQPGTVLEPVRPHVAGSAQTRLGQSGTGEAGRPHRDRPRLSPVAAGAVHRPFDHRGDVLPGARLQTGVRPGDEVEELPAGRGPHQVPRRATSGGGGRQAGVAHAVTHHAGGPGQGAGAQGGQRRSGGGGPRRGELGDVAGGPVRGEHAPQGGRVALALLEELGTHPVHEDQHGAPGPRGQVETGGRPQGVGEVRGPRHQRRTRVEADRRGGGGHDLAQVRLRSGPVRGRWRPGHLG